MAGRVFPLSSASTALDEFVTHLQTCTVCDLKLDGSGPLCPEGEALNLGAAWDTWAAQEAARLLALLVG